MSILKRVSNVFDVKSSQDFRGLFVSVPISFAEDFPEVPEPAERLDPKLLAAQWVLGDLRGEDMPGIAADLLEAGHDSPALRRLAGEFNVTCSADVGALVEKALEDLCFLFPFYKSKAKQIYTRQVAREVIHGKRNPWAAASHLEIVVWSREAGNADIQNVFELRDQLNWDNANKEEIPRLTSELVKTFAGLGGVTNGEKVIRSMGSLEGEGWIADDFDAPLPDWLQAQFEGRDDPHGF